MSKSVATEELFVNNGDITIRAEVTGDGPVVVCVHGWPESPGSWRHQVEHLSRRGFRVAAIDVRGYGGSSIPDSPERYTLRELSDDVAAVATALTNEPVVLMGHDWGAPIVWTTAIRHPGQVRGVVGMSVPHAPSLGISLTDVFEALYPDRFFYMLHFQAPGVIEAEFAADMRDAFKRVFHALSGEAPLPAMASSAPRGTPFLSLLPDPPDGPLGFLTDAELDRIVASFERTGIVGAVNRYRAMPFDVDGSADIVGAHVAQPSCFIGGEADLVRYLIPGSDWYADPGAACDDFRGATIIPGVGHWVQQEAPEQVNAAVDAFLATL